jgi:hypothetical protein
LIDKKQKFMAPNRTDTFQGVYLPAWLFTLGIGIDAIVTWGVMARCAGRKRVLKGFTASRIAEITGISVQRTRRAINDLSSGGVIAVTPENGSASVYRFLSPEAIAREGGARLTWARVVAEKDAGDEPYWREW